ncbi:MAG TPA: hypothetical protein H9870_03085 [Candidatus Corynebacterium avicola]|uniref:EamA domain-containing protein n=1 Tax=Candidatus Corynebacterium avicola TaxID=2838527 RepID=A0A9D1RM62_9CORY|nr:hypothetical protein [Candidatus Corynebacterium avicola]
MLHSLWNAVVKRDGGATTRSGLAFLWFYSTLSSLVAAIYLTWMETGIAIPCVVSALVHTGYVVCLQPAYRAGALSMVLPVVRGGAPALLCLGAVLTSGSIAPSVVAGTGVVVVGIVIAARAEDSSGRLIVSLCWAVAAALFSAGYTAWDAFAVTSLEVESLDFLAGSTICQWFIVSVPLAFSWMREGRFPLHRDDFPPRRIGAAATVAVLAPASYGLTILAMTMASADVVAVGKTLTVLCAGITGALFFRERPAWGGLILIAGGVWLAAV